MRTHLSLALLGFLSLAGCASPDGDTPAEQRAYALQVRSEALSQLAIRDATAMEKLETAPGYIFVSGFAIHPGLLTFGNAYGIVQNNATGEQTHVRLTRFAVGPGLALKGYYGVVTLPSEEAITKFKDGAWYPLAWVEASLKFGDFGGSADAGAVEDSTYDGWLWTHTGFSVEVAAGGGKLYPEEDLN